MGYEDSKETGKQRFERLLKKSIKEIYRVLKHEGIRVKLNDRADKIGSKISQAELDKINFMLIVGQKESDEETVSIRKRFEGDMGTMPLNDFKDKIVDEINNRRLTHR